MLFVSLVIVDTTAAPALYIVGPGGHLGTFWVGMCRPGLQIGTPFKEKNSPKIDTPF